MNHLSIKLILGSVQFGMPYGVSNCNGIPDDVELKKILSTALDYNINTIDSAAAYGNAEERLGKFCDGNFNIISKFPKYDEVSTTLFTSIERSLRVLKTEQLYGYMAHDADDLIHFPFLWEELCMAKKQGKVNKIGYSLYSVRQLDALLSAGLFPDIIQVPYNIFDRRFKESLEYLNQNNVEVHSRSVFLQGLFFLSPETLKPIFKPLEQDLINLQSACFDHEIAIPRAALGFVKAEKCIDKIVIGITSASELKANIEYLNGDDLEMAFLSKLEKIHIKESQLLNPGNWN